MDARRARFRAISEPVTLSPVLLGPQLGALLSPFLGEGSPTQKDQKRVPLF